MATTVLSVRIDVEMYVDLVRYAKHVTPQGGNHRETLAALVRGALKERLRSYSKDPASGVDLGILPDFQVSDQ